MLKMLLPKDAGFFGYFLEMADLICECTREFHSLLVASPDLREAHGQRIKQLEHAADEVTHRTMSQLRQTFITPIDREDIHLLIKRLDDVMDFLDAASQRIVLYKIGEVPPDMHKMADLNSACADHLKTALGLLDKLKNTDLLQRTCVDINRLENEADLILRSAVARLFSDEPDTRLLIKLKEIYELLETVTDRCEDVANVIDSIVIEYS